MKMRFNKVIYIRYIPLTEKIYKDFYMDEVQKAGIDMEYWDISPLFFKQDFNQESVATLTKVKKFQTYEQLEESILKMQPLHDKLFISIMTFEGRITRLYRILNKYNCILAVFGRNMFPVPPIKKTWASFLEKLSIARLQGFLRTRRLMKQKSKGLIKSYNIMFFRWKSRLAWYWSY